MSKGICRSVPSVVRNALLLMLVFYPVYIQANENPITILNTHVSQSKLDRISEHPQWLALLHYEKQGLIERFYSEVDDERFFYSDKGKTDARLELLATLKEFEKNESGDDSIFCRFPARLHFLQESFSQ